MPYRSDSRDRRRSRTRHRDRDYGRDRGYDRHRYSRSRYSRHRRDDYSPDRRVSRHYEREYDRRDRRDRYEKYERRDRDEYDRRGRQRDYRSRDRSRDYGRGRHYERRSRFDQYRHRDEGRDRDYSRKYREERYDVFDRLARRYREEYGHREYSRRHRDQKYGDNDDQREYENRQHVRSVSSASEASDDASNTDEIVHFDWKPGQLLGDRQKYEVESALGDGTFGRVLKCRDERGQKVAIKVIRNVKRYAENAKIEANILEKVRDRDVNDEFHCARILDRFDYHGYYCLVFDILGPSLYDFIKANKYHGMAIEDIRIIAHQSCQALRFLHDDMELTHTDLKLENLLLVDGEYEEVPREGRRHATTRRPLRCDIKIIDFGNATFRNDHHSSIVNTRQYRAPEVILGCGWDERSDMWSLGCILMELYLGELLFGTHDNAEHLALIEKVLGPIPQEIFQKASSENRSKYLRRQVENRELYELNWPEKAESIKSVKYVDKTTSLEQHFDLEDRWHRDFHHFVKGLLIHDPERRPTAARALTHSFLRDLDQSHQVPTPVMNGASSSTVGDYNAPVMMSSYVDAREEDVPAADEYDFEHERYPADSMSGTVY